MKDIPYNKYDQVAEEMISLKRNLPDSLILKAILELVYFSPESGGSAIMQELWKK